MASRDIITDLMKQYGGNPADADYWAGQYESQGTNFLGSPSFKSMTGQAIDDSTLNLLKTIGAGGSGGRSADQTVDFSNSGLSNNTEFKDLMGRITKTLPAWEQAIGKFGTMEEMLDQYKDEATKTGRTSFDDVWATINQAGNVSAARGMGGSEQNALKSRMLSDLVGKEEARRLGILKDVTGLKTTARMAAPGLMFQNLQALMSMFGTEASDNINWAQMISQLIQSGYTG